VHARAGQFGELHELGLAAADRDAVADEDHRGAGVDEQASDALGRLGAGADFRVDIIRREDLGLGLLVHHVCRYGDERRAARRFQRQLEGAAQEDGQFGGVAGLDGPLRERLGQAHDVAREERVLAGAALRVLTGVDDERCAGAERVVKHAHRVAEAGRDVQLQEGRPARGARVTVGDARRDAFVEREYVFELRVVLQGVQEALLGGAGIAEDVLRTVCQELLDHQVPAGEACHVGLLSGRRIARSQP